MHVKTTLFGLLLAVSPMATQLGCSDDASNDGKTGTGASASGGAGSGASGTGGAGATAGGGTTGGTGTTGGGTGTGATGNTGGIPLPTEISTCQGHIYECGDLLDNDGDGLVDAQDPDCLGPCDDTEDSFYGGIPGQAGPACQVDCYFDQDSGSGNDDCYWDHDCDPFSVAPDYYPEPDGQKCEYTGMNPIIPPTGKTCTQLNDTQSQECHDFCGPLTPNGCDCFGCCELPAGGGEYVWLGSEGLDGTTVCSIADLANPDICHPCTPVDDCLNGCLPCEICIGKPLPGPECGAGGGGVGGNGAGGNGSGQCPPGDQACGLPGQDACGVNQYCITGCCQDVPS